MLASDQLDDHVNKIYVYATGYNHYKHLRSFSYITDRNLLYSWSHYMYHAACNEENIFNCIPLSFITQTSVSIIHPYTAHAYDTGHFMFHDHQNDLKDNQDPFFTDISCTGPASSLTA
jgi:hypothetical protein